MKNLIFVIFSLFPLIGQTQVIFNCLDKNGNQKIIYHDNNYMHFSLNNKIYHVHSVSKNTHYIKAKIRHNCDVKNIYIYREKILIRDEKDKVIANYKIIKSV